MQTLRDLQRTALGVTARAYLIEDDDPNARTIQLNQLLSERKLELPFILKPDVGQRGVGFRLVKNLEAGIEYVQRVNAPVIAQQYAPGPREAGIFYYRLPNESNGRIFAMTEKVFPTIVGDGVSTIEQLIHADARAAIIARTYLRRFSLRRNEILPKGESLKLVEAGNHAQGCTLRDGAHLATPALAAKIDQLSRALPGFYIGRYDVRYAHDQELQAGRNFLIVELNGAASEATNIYDERCRLIEAYRILFRQWRLGFAIGQMNKRRGHRSSKISELWQAWRNYSRIALRYPCSD